VLLPEEDSLILSLEISSKRASTLAHQVSKFSSSIGSISSVILNFDSLHLPSSRRTPSPSPFSFDLIICDVPCSGDGTLRKAPDIWSKWKITDGINLHKKQISILKKGLNLLKEGGRLVYSTCSLNPIENEAVVSYCLSLSFSPEWEYSLIDFEIQGSRPGQSNWIVPPNRGKGEERASSLFPPIDENIQRELRKAKRFYPHDELNSGGFFLAVFTKKTRTPPNPAAASAVSPLPLPVHSIHASTDDEFRSISEFYGLPNFLSELVIKKGNVFHLVSKRVKAFLALSTTSSSGAAGGGGNIPEKKIVKFGIKGFLRLNSSISENFWGKFCEYRLCQDGVNFLFKHISNKRKLFIRNKLLFVKLLKRTELELSELIEGDREEAEPQPPFDRVGGVLVVLEEEEKEAGGGGGGEHQTPRLCLSGMISLKMLSIFVEKTLRENLISLLEMKL